MKAVQNPAPAEKRIHSVKLTTEHVEALVRATEILTALGDIISPCQDHDPFWLILRHINMDPNWTARRSVPRRRRGPG